MTTRTLPREFYIHKGATPISREGIDGIVYTYEVGAKPLAMAFIGKQSKPTWHFSFRNDAERANRIEVFFANLQGHQDWKAKQHTERKQFIHGFKVGDILYASWGYDQTNIDFFQVTAISEKQVTFREIQASSAGEDGFMCDHCVAVPDSYTKNTTEFTRTVGKGSNNSPEGYVTFAEGKGSYKRHLSKWDGKPLYRSWYA